MRWKPLIFAGFAAASAVGAYFFFQSLRGYEEFRVDRNAAHDLIRQGWVSNCISKTASDINVKYVVETNEVWGRYLYREDPFSCETDIVKQGLPVSPRADWWITKRAFDPTTVHSIRGERRTYAVIDSGAKTVFFWKLET